MSSDSRCASQGCGFSTEVSAASTCAVHVLVGGVFCCVRSSDSVIFCIGVTTLLSVQQLWLGGGEGYWLILLP